MITTSVIKALSLGLAGAVLVAAGSLESAQAATLIDTHDDWLAAIEASEPGIFPFVTPFGTPVTPTYGQTFTVETHNVLQSFSFWLGDDISRQPKPQAAAISPVQASNGVSGPTIDFAGYLMEWDGAKASGPVLFKSAQRSKQLTPDFEEFRFDTGNLVLTPGRQYVAFLSATEFFRLETRQTRMGYVDNDVYAGGSFVFSNQSSFAALTSTRWQTLIGDEQRDAAEGVEDAAFVARFAPEPQAIPTPALLPGLIGLGVKLFRQRKAIVAPNKTKN
jgi:hypothetical protein